MPIRIPRAVDAGLGQRLPEVVPQPVKKALPAYVAPPLVAEPNLNRINIESKIPLLMGEAVSKGLMDISKTGMEIALNQQAFEERQAIIEKLKQEKTFEKEQISNAQVYLAQDAGKRRIGTKSILENKELTPKQKHIEFNELLMETRDKFKENIPSQHQVQFKDDFERGIVQEQAYFLENMKKQAEDKMKSDTTNILAEIETQTANGQRSIEQGLNDSFAAIESNQYLSEVEKTTAKRTAVKSIYQNDVLKRENDPAQINSLYADLTARDKDGNPLAYKGLDPTEREVYTARVKQLLKVSNVTQYFNELSFKNTNSDGSLDYAKIFKDVQNPAIFSKYNLTAEEAGQVANLFNAQKIRENAIKKEMFDKNADVLWKRVQDKKENPIKLITEIKDAVISDTLEREPATQFINALTNPAIKTDSTTYLKIKEHILENKADREGNKKLIYNNLTRLEQNDAASLMTTALSESKEVETKILKRNYDFLKSQLAPSKGMLAAGSPGEDDNLKRALDAFDVLIEDAQKAGKPLDQKNVDELSRQIIKAYSPDVTTRMQWQKESILGTLGDIPLGSIKPTAKPSQQFETLPPANQHKGETFQDTGTGKKHKSDGTNWSEVK